MDAEEEIKKLKERNSRVEADKAWETSKTRYATIAIITYVFAFLFLFLAGIANPQLNAFVPVLGFFLATFTFPPLKSWWVENIYNK
jgi:hypothetical protein